MKALLDPAWYAVHTGKCSFCDEVKTLDSMIANDAKKGLYHCLDCETEIYADFTLRSSATVTASQPLPRLKILWSWVFG